MKKIFNSPVIFALLFIIIFTQCNKSHDLPEFYYRCKVDGQDYRPNGCANCLTCTILGDTTFLLGANRGFEVVSIGIIKLDHSFITAAVYDLNANPQQNALYDNSPLVNDIFRTDSLRTGVLQIISIDKASKIILGTFSFQAYNAVQNKVVNVTEGKFRWKYTIN